ncbi:MAG: diacylglycerol kinase [Anaerorhabdus sp.]
MINKFLYALNGLFIAVKSLSIRLLIYCAIIAALFSYIFKFSLLENIVIILCGTIVICTEMGNEAIERICDMVNPTYDKRIKEIKDIAAGATLIASSTSLIIGIIIVLRHI